MSIAESPMPTTSTFLSCEALRGPVGVGVHLLPANVPGGEGRAGADPSGVRWRRALPCSAPRARAVGLAASAPPRRRRWADAGDLGAEADSVSEPEVLDVAL